MKHRRLIALFVLALALGTAAFPSLAGERPTGKLNRMWSQGKAVGKGPVKFTHAPINLEDIEFIIPYGLMVGAHVLPTDHQYYYPKVWRDGRKQYDVMAPAVGFVVQIGHRVMFVGSSEKQRDYDDYSLVIEHSSTFYTHYDLLTGLDESILSKLDDASRAKLARKAGGAPHQVRIPVKAGQVLGKVGGRTLDFDVVNEETTLKGLLTPKLYGHHAWRFHLVDPFDYFEEPLRGKLLKLNLRKAEPRGGRIDYDIDGKLVGNWFKEGTGGFSDNRDPRGYWMGHLAIVYHHLDPRKIMVSIGDYEGKPRQLWVKGNAPDPAKVDKATGPVKYELVPGSYDKGYGLPLDREGEIQGVLLAQVLDGRRLKVEVFPGKTGDEVTGFTKAAASYER